LGKNNAENLAEKHTPYDNIVSRYELLCKASSLLVAGQFKKSVIPKRGFIAARNLPFARRTAGPSPGFQPASE
jgi:hypothetical protein